MFNLWNKKYPRRKSWQRCECSLCFASKPLRQWKELPSVIYFLPLNIPKRPSIENIGILYNYGPGLRGTNAQRLPSATLENLHLCQDLLGEFPQKKGSDHSPLGNGTYCEDILECETGQHLCDSEAFCINLNGGYSESCFN